MADYGDTGSTRDVARKLELSADVLQEKSARMTGKAASAIHSAADRIGNIDVEQYHARMREMVDSARAEVDRNVKNVETGIKDHPFESVAIAAGAGIMAGAIIAYMGSHAARRYSAETR